MENLNLTSKENNIQSKIDQAKLNAITPDVYRSLTQKHFQYLEKIDKDNLDPKMLDYYNNEIKQIEDTIEKSSVACDNLFEFKTALRSLNIKEENIVIHCLMRMHTQTN